MINVRQQEIYIVNLLDGSCTLRLQSAQTYVQCIDGSFESFSMQPKRWTLGSFEKYTMSKPWQIITPNCLHLEQIVYKEWLGIYSSSHVIKVHLAIAVSICFNPRPSSVTSISSYRYALYILCNIKRTMVFELFLATAKLSLITWSPCLMKGCFVVKLYIFI